MNRKFTVFCTTVVFIVSLSSCIQIKRTAKTEPGRLHGSEAYRLEIIAAQKKNGERLDFPKKNWATVSGSALLVPDAEGSVPPKIAWSDVKGFRRNSEHKVVFVEMNDGTAYRVRNHGIYKHGIAIRVGTAYRPIALSEFDLVWVRKVNWPLSVAANTVTTLGVALIVLAATWEGLYFNPLSGAESCPFVYSFNGQEYVLDAEPYGGAVCAGLERTDWVRMDHLVPAGGRYKVLLANELEEVEHVNEVKLVVVDHPEGVAVASELSGRMRTIAAPSPPVSARDRDGRDILPLVRSDDGTFWLSRVEGRDPERDEDLKDELVLEFAKPTGAGQAKLVANAWWTQWGSQAVKPILATQGGELRSFFDKIDARGPALLSVMSWFASEEMYNLQVRVETTAGWKTKALVFGGGPMIAKDKAYSLDLSDVPGETVRLKLTPAAGFWMIDRVALDFSEDIPVTVTELEAVSARDEAGRDIGGLLAAADEEYFVIPKGAGPAAIEFAAPPPPAPDSGRTIFVKAAGYYDLMLNGEGERTLDLDEVMRRPGESIRIALRSHPSISRPVSHTAERNSRTQ